MIGCIDLIAATSQSEARDVQLDTVIVPKLEEWTGADLIISPVDLPMIAPAVIRQHLAEGAVLVQVKRGHDLAASIHDRRMTRSLARMKATGASQSQCILLFIGYLSYTRNGAKINSTDVKGFGNQNAYWTIQSAMAHWNARGGVIEQIAGDYLFNEWVSRTEYRVKDYRDNGTVVVGKPAPSAIHPLQDVYEIDDWRNTLMTFPTIGLKRALQIYDYMQENKMELSLLQALSLLTSPQATQIPGVGSHVSNSVRAWLGLEEGFEIGVEVSFEKTS